MSAAYASHDHRPSRDRRPQGDRPYRARAHETRSGDPRSRAGRSYGAPESAEAAPATRPAERRPHVDPTAALLALNLPEALLDAVLDLGFVTPTPVQAQVIPALLAGHDVLGVAQTGTGKTAAFGLPLLAGLEPHAGQQALVVVPTRELALQVSQALAAFARHLPGVHVVAVYGGAPTGPQRRALLAGAQVVVGTPGRLMDHMARGAFDPSGVTAVVLDEADEMLRMGFAEDVDTILSALPRPRRTALLSATMPPAIASVAARHLVDPVRVEVSRPASTAETVEQTFAVVPAAFKVAAAARVLATTDADAAIVFTRTRQAADEVGGALLARGLRAATVSGDVAQSEREAIVARLRSGDLDVLVATDVAARGLDVERVGLVLNLDVPIEPDAYVHRIGRTGRAGRSGRALTFVTPDEEQRLRVIERLTQVTMTEVTVPTVATVAAHRAARLVDQVAARRAAGDLEPYRAAVARALADGTDPVELAAVLVALAVEGGQASGDGSADGDLEPTPMQAARGATVRDGRVAFTQRLRSRAAARPAVGGTRYRVEVGRNHGVGPGHVVGALTGEGGLTGAQIGKVEVMSTFSLVDLTTELTPEAMRRIGVARVSGRQLRISADHGPGSGARGQGRPAAGARMPQREARRRKI
jgi:ATP-dependent RNA helicase DeaD